MSRRIAREIALKILFQIDVGKNDVHKALNFTLEEEQPSEEMTGYIHQVVLGTVSKLNEIDGWIERFAIDWTIKRMANVDRNLLRLAVYEILFMEDIPPQVSINEAVELAKKYSTEESGKFINGILGKLVQEVHKQQTNT